ncbi:MAG TPA: Ig-like domain-containing protein [Gemmatimonadales bacterium]
MRRWTLLAGAVALASGCFEGNAPTSDAQLRVSPLLDSLFVGDTQTPPLTVIYISSGGDTLPAGRVTWTTGDPAVATVDSLGRVAGVGPGPAVITARTGNVLGRALVVVSRTLDVTLLLDTVYLMPGDTFTVPAQVLRRGGGAPAAWFAAQPQPQFDIDSATGLVTANAASANAVPFVVHADTVADTGAVHVRTLSDTTGGRAYFTLFGTVIRLIGTQARAINYRLRDNSQAFRLSASVVSRGLTVENLFVTLIDSVTAPGTFVLDSLSPLEALGVSADFVCQPPRPWGLWGSALFEPPINALSRRFGSISVTQLDTVANGLAVSGRFEFRAQRMDYYDDPGGVIPIRGTFVVPLITDLNTCP